jgi:hypothetical protein
MAESRLDKAALMIAHARIALDHDALESAVSRAYYAMYHAARVALAWEDPEAAGMERHGSVIGRFGIRIARHETMGLHFGRSLNRAYEYRRQADYDLGSTIDRSVAAKVFEDAVQLHEAVAALIRLPQESAR